MGACEVLNLVLNIFASFSHLRWKMPCYLLQIFFSLLILHSGRRSVFFRKCRFHSSTCTYGCVCVCVCVLNVNVHIYVCIHINQNMSAVLGKGNYLHCQSFVAKLLDSAQLHRLSARRACKATLWLTSDLNKKDFDSPRFSAVGTLVNASVVSNHQTS